MTRTIRTRAFAALGLAAFVAGGVAFSQDGADVEAAAETEERTPVEFVGDRQKAMRDMQIPNGFFLSQLRGSAEPDYATISAQADIMKANLELSMALFPPHTTASGDVEGAHVRALDIVWEQKDQFDALFIAGIEATDALKVAADAGDRDAALAAAQAINKACSDCHVAYRE